MKPVYQSVVSKDTGDCMRAAVASLFELDLDQVPNFRKFPDGQWWNVFWYFLYSLGYEYVGWAKPDTHKTDKPVLATVESRTLQGSTHSVIMDRDGLVIHDPNPNKAFIGVNVIESGELAGWYMIEKRAAEAAQ